MNRGVFIQAWLDTMKAVVRDKGALLFLVVAPLFYGFFYPWPFSTQVVTRVPVAIVDLDHSSLSRQITRFAQASPRLDVALVTGDERDARQALWKGDIEGYAILPKDLKRNVLRGEAAVVPVEGNGAYLLLNKTVLTGFAEAVGTVSAGIEIKKLQSKGQSARQAADSRSPINTQLVALFNPDEGYGNYAVPAVAIIIIQQTLLMGVALLVGTWAESAVHRAGTHVWLGRIAAFSTFGVFMGLLYLGWIFAVHEYPRAANIGGAVLLLMLFIPAVAALGALAGLVFANRERAIQVLLFTSIPMAFLSGFSWPGEALPYPLQLLRWLIPSTAGIQASLRLNQMGASIADVAGYLGVLAGLAVLAGIALCIKGRAR
ncbi:ABC transporter permease [Noviherbaspirillum sp. UKPF54]|uniref:ABC transporter permease n=1 Tax=Noviherbaspirillum sp. UKPF54 TaxID=2601898 RepID=UPI0011B16781|nr:ABC transporter permease [Noviherbaspirillum sp. UKPF54]QDZ30432.1 ABC transporter permease [Noviherbaspirillum sp. UKPF54]